MKLLILIAGFLSSASALATPFFFTDNQLNANFLSVLAEFHQSYPERVSKRYMRDGSEVYLVYDKEDNVAIDCRSKSRTCAFYEQLSDFKKTQNVHETVMMALDQQKLLNPWVWHTGYSVMHTIGFEKRHPLAWVNHSSIECMTPPDGKGGLRFSQAQCNFNVFRTMDANEASLLYDWLKNQKAGYRLRELEQSNDFERTGFSLSESLTGRSVGLKHLQVTFESRAKPVPAGETDAIYLKFDIYEKPESSFVMSASEFLRRQ